MSKFTTWVTSLMSKPLEHTSLVRPRERPGSRADSGVSTWFFKDTLKKHRILRRFASSKLPNGLESVDWTGLELSRDMDHDMR